jgi:hypothetical protein
VLSTHVAQLAGRPAVVFADSGERITTSADATDEAITRAIAAYVSRLNAPRRISVSTWNGEDVLKSPGEAVLKAAGFDRTPGGMSRSYG